MNTFIKSLTAIALIWTPRVPHGLDPWLFADVGLDSQGNPLQADDPRFHRLPKPATSSSSKLRDFVADLGARVRLRGA